MASSPLEQRYEGRTARVSGTIKPGKEGEIMVDAGQGSQAYPARAADPKEEIPAGTQVYVTDQLGRCLYVTT